VDTTIGEYAWVERPRGRDTGNPCTAESGCITVALSAGERDVLDALGADGSAVVQRTFHEAELVWSEEATPVQVWTDGSSTVLVEPNGYLASLSDCLEKIARKGEAVSVFWNVNGQMQVMVARDGAVVREFDPLMYDAGDALPEEAGLPFDTEEHALAAALAFLARRTGFVASEVAILGSPRATYIVRRA
jgi:hypothetical protein